MMRGVYPPSRARERDLPGSAPARLLTVSLLSLALGACGDIVPAAPDANPGDMGGGVDGGVTVPSGLAASFEVVVTPTFESNFPLPGGLPDEHAFVLRLDDQGGETRGIVGMPGLAVMTRFLEQADGTLSLAAPFSLPGTPDGFLCPIGDLVYEQLGLTLLDTDSDGTADRLSGTASGFVTVTGFDVLATFEAQVEAALDSTPPDLILPGDVIDHHVMDPILVLATEPLPGDLALSLASESHAPIALRPESEDAPAVARFSSPEDVILPFGATLRIEGNTPLYDLAGIDNPDALPRSVQIMPDPGAFAEDGFEGAQMLAHVQGDAQVVAGTQTLPAITDARSLRIGSGGRVTMRIPLQSGDTQVSLRVRGLYATQAAGPLAGTLEIGAPGAQGIVRISLPNTPTQQRTETGDPEWQFAGTTTTLAGSLPAGASGSAVVSIDLSTRQQGCPGTFAGDTAVLVDDLRAEPASSSEPQPASTR